MPREATWDVREQSSFSVFHSLGYYKRSRRVNKGYYKGLVLQLVVFFYHGKESKN